MPNKPLEDISPDELIDWNLRPFRPKEADQVKELLRKIIIAAKHPDTNAVECKCWCEVIEAARLAEFLEQQVLDEKEEGPGPRSRFREKLNKIIKGRNPKLPRDMELLIPLALGACDLGLIRRPPELLEAAAYLKALSKLTGAQIRESAMQALKSPFLVAGKGGRPSAATFDGYVKALMGIYERASDTNVIRQPAPNAINARQLSDTWRQLRAFSSPPRERRKRNNMRLFIHACLAPFKTKSDYCDAAISYSDYRKKAIEKSARRVIKKSAPRVRRKS